MKTIAFLSNFGQICPVSQYGEVLSKTLADIHDLTCITLPVCAGQSTHMVRRKIDEIAADLQKYDIVVYQFELGLYGIDAIEIARNLNRLINQSKQIILTVHSLHIHPPMGKKEWLKRVVASRGISSHLSALQLEKHNRNNLHEVLTSLKRHHAKHAVSFCVHSRDDVIKLTWWGYAEPNQIVDFPVIYTTQAERDRVAELDQSILNFRHRNGFGEDDVLIGVFGFVNWIKSHIVPIKALKHLPKNYKLVIGGGMREDTLYPQHFMLHDPLASNEHSDPYFRALIDCADVFLDLHPGRLVFLGSMKDTEYALAQCAMDFHICAHAEVGISGSASAARILEMQCRALMSRCSTFKELAKYYPDGFSIFDLGNHLELAHKLVTWDESKLTELAKAVEVYTLENRTELYRRLIETSASDAYAYHQQLRYDAGLPTL